MTDGQAFLLQRVQTAMVGLIDGSLSTLAPIFSVAVVTHRPHFAFIAGVATAFGAGISMAFAEALSDDGSLTGRGRPLLRGAVTGLMTAAGGIGHSPVDRAIHRLCDSDAVHPEARDYYPHEQSESDCPQPLR